MKAGRYMVKMRYFLRISLVSLIMDSCGDQYVDSRQYDVFDCVEPGAYKGIKAFRIKDMEPEEAEEQLENELWTAVYHNATIKGFPPELYERMYTYLDIESQELAAQWDISQEEYLDLFIGMDLKSYAEDMTKYRLVLEAIVKQENLGLSEEEYENMLSSYAQEYGFKDSKEMELEYGKDKIVDFLAAQKTYGLIADEAVITEVTQEAYRKIYNIE